jgi:transcriptional regulator GlxA family with amidase domain
LHSPESELVKGRKPQVAADDLAIGILLFEGVEELDFVGPWEVLGLATEGDDRIFTVADRANPVRANLGLRVLPDYTFESVPDLNVLVVPGGRGTRRVVAEDKTVAWIRGIAADCRWVCGVCTGAFLLHAAGLLENRRATTHWASMARLRDEAGVTAVPEARFVVDGTVITSAGISAGIDMALWLVEQIKSPAKAREVRRRMEYLPHPSHGRVPPSTPRDLE